MYSIFFHENFDTLLKLFFLNKNKAIVIGYCMGGEWGQLYKMIMPSFSYNCYCLSDFNSGPFIVPEIRGFNYFYLFLFPNFI